MNNFVEVTAGLWIGDLLRPYRGEFDYVLTLSDRSPRSDDGLHHRFLPLPVRRDEVHPLLDTAVAWIRPRWQAQRSLLVQSPQYTWAEVAVGALFVHLGAGVDEAISSLRQARADALSQQHFLDLLRGREVPRA